VEKTPVVTGFLFTDRGDVVLRGFEEPVRLYQVHWREA
jgi:class 3 adenylate cyclase